MEIEDDKREMALLSAAHLLILHANRCWCTWTETVKAHSLAEIIFSLIFPWIFFFFFFLTRISFAKLRNSTNGLILQACKLWPVLDPPPPEKKKFLIISSCK